MGKRYMTIDDLYNFCLKNNFGNFNSTDDEIVVQMPATFEKTDDSYNKFTESMTPFVAKAFHDHINLNKSEIPEDSFQKNVPSANLRPILANIVKDEDTGELDFGSHDFHVEKDEDGNDKQVYDEQPVGVIDGTQTTIEYDEDAKVNRAILHGFLYDGYCQDAVDILNRRKETACSVELAIRAMSFNTADNVLTLEDWYVTGLTLLGSTVKPGMAGSNVKIEDFSAKNSIVENLEQSQNEKLIEMLDRLTTILSSFNIGNTPDNSTKGGNAEMNKFEELCQKYGKTAEDITFEYANMSDEELEAAFAEAFEDDCEGEPTVDPVVPEPDVQMKAEPKNHKFTISNGVIERSFEVSHEDIRYALYNLIAQYDELDNDWYMIESVYDAHFIMRSWCTDSIYGQKYIVDGENVALDGERYKLFQEYLTESEKAQLDDMRSNYSSIVSELDDVKATLAKYEAEPEKVKLLNSDDYQQIKDTKEFVALMEKDGHFDISIDDVRSKADSILLNYAKAGKLSFAVEKPETKIVRMSVPSGDDNAKKPYGGIFENYKK